MTLGQPQNQREPSFSKFGEGEEINDTNRSKRGILDAEQNTPPINSLDCNEEFRKVNIRDSTRRQAFEISQFRAHCRTHKASSLRPGRKRVRRGEGNERRGIGIGAT